MARLDEHFDSDFALQRLRDLLRKEISIANDSPSDIEAAEAKALRDNPTKTPRIDILTGLLLKYTRFRYEEHFVRIRQIQLARNTLKDTYLRRDLEFSTDQAKSYELLLAKISPDKLGVSSLRQRVVHALAVQRSYQKKC